jgi:hypothetical protein
MLVFVCIEVNDDKLRFIAGMGIERAESAHSPES